MTVGEGKFVLYSRIEPPLEAGEYRFTASQSVTATGYGQGALPVADLPTYVTVRSPRYTLPPDQVLSTYPPANHEGDYGSRLPQVVIRRRTLPWERSVQHDVPRSTPWLALVLIAEGEAEIALNQPVAQCVTPGVALPGTPDTELGNCLRIRKSMVDRVFPTQLDVPLLAHAREVDIHDTELMMGDDDGFLAVVIANRLPLTGRDDKGNPVPVKYLACLVNLEGQFTRLLERAPDPAPFTVKPTKFAALQADQASWDHMVMGTASAGASGGGAGAGVSTGASAGAGPSIARVVGVPSAAAAPYTPASTWAAAAPTVRGHADVYAEMAADFGHASAAGFVGGHVIQIDPTLTFPVLLHWSFTSHGSVTFRSLMEGLDSGLLGTVGDKPVDDTGRTPMEVVETGHVGLTHRTRRGDVIRSWYRGPFVAHPTQDPPGGRLPLAHSADQIRIVVPDGREDISLAAAFEIGRLLALSRPSMIAALLRWRATGYQFSRRNALWRGLQPFLSQLLGDTAADARMGVRMGRALADAIAAGPRKFLGDPRPLVDPGRALPIDGPPAAVLSAGFNLQPDLLSGDLSTVVDRLRVTPPVSPLPSGAVPWPAITTVLGDTLHSRVSGLVADTLALPPEAPLPVVTAIDAAGVSRAGVVVSAAGAADRLGSSAGAADAPHRTGSGTDAPRVEREDDR
jgi:hypothetical protein